MKRLPIFFSFVALLLLVQPVAHAQQNQPITRITFSKEHNALKLYGKDDKQPFKTITLDKTYDVHTYDAVKKDSVWVVGIENAKKGVIICTVDSLGKQTVCTYYPSGEAYNLDHHPKTLNVPAVLEGNDWKHKK
ncbi:MAG: hypothetical protein HGA87_06110 [Desulfobulbaceae bacterium]|nr:hypothetical protein [Desulfobulbaceae bacterium]